MTAIQQDAVTNEDLGPMSEDEAAELLLRRFTPPDEKKEGQEDAQKPSSEEKPDEDKQEQKPEPDDKKDEDSAEKPEDDSDDTEDSAEAVYKFTADGKEVEIPISQLARLYGQEAALTRKSMELAEHRKHQDAEISKATGATAALLERAKARFEPFSKLDFNKLYTELEPQVYQQIRQEAQAAWEDVEFLQTNLDGFTKAVQERQSVELQAKAKEAIKVLQDPETGIEGWSQALYDDIRAYAIGRGAPAEVINQVVDPWAIKMMHQSMMYERGMDKAKVKVVKVNKTPKKIVKTTDSPAVARQDGTKSKNISKAYEKLRSTGSLDDATDLIMERWKQETE